MTWAVIAVRFGTGAALGPLYDQWCAWLKELGPRGRKLAAGKGAPPPAPDRCRGLERRRPRSSRRLLAAASRTSRSVGGASRTPTPRARCRARWAAPAPEAFSRRTDRSGGEDISSCKDAAGTPFQALRRAETTPPGGAAVSSTAVAPQDAAPASQDRCQLVATKPRMAGPERAVPPEPSGESVQHQQQPEKGRDFIFGVAVAKSASEKGDQGGGPQESQRAAPSLSDAGAINAFVKKGRRSISSGIFEDHFERGDGLPLPARLGSGSGRGLVADLRDKGPPRTKRARLK